MLQPQDKRTHQIGIGCHIAVGDDLSMGQAAFGSGTDDGANGIGIQKRLAAKGHDGLELKQRRRFPHSPRGHSGVKHPSPSRMIAL